MSFLLFMDESGHDRRASPYEVLAGVCIEDRDLWNFICDIQDSEERFFGCRVTEGLLELKATKLLSKKVYRLARQLPGMIPEDRARLARQCLEKGAAARGKADRSPVTRAELTALAQAKLAYVEHILEVCARYRVRAFASIVDRDAPGSERDFLRRDYAFLFERFYYYLDDQPGRQQGIVVFDELEHTLSHLLIDQMSRYFRDTARGRARASLVIPEPFFVHSHLTTGVQVADLIAYIVSWGFRVGNLDRPARAELVSLGDRVADLRYRTTREIDGQENFVLWSFVLLDDLRCRDERSGEETGGQ